MSNNSSSSFSFSASSFSSSTSTSQNGQTQTSSSGQRQMQSSFTDAQGNTTVHSSHQTMGQPAIHESRQFDHQGNLLVGSGDNTSGSARQIEGGRVEDVTDQDEEQAKRDREYEERMEDEYAKREGGA